MLTGTYEQHRIFSHSFLIVCDGLTWVKGDINEFSPFVNKSVQDRNKHIFYHSSNHLKPPKTGPWDHHLSSRQLSLSQVLLVANSLRLPATKHNQNLSSLEKNCFLG